MYVRFCGAHVYYVTKMTQVAQHLDFISITYTHMMGIFRFLIWRRWESVSITFPVGLSRAVEILSYGKW